jgi:Ca-activated chloride channel family protein
MRLANPEFLWLLLLIPLGALFYWFTHYRKISLMKKLVDRNLWSKIYNGYSPTRGWIRALLWFTALFFLIAAVIDPQIGTKTRKLKRKGVDIVVALDVSRSMLATDIPPSRLKKAKYLIQEMIEMLQGDRIGLIAFAGIAHPQCPLTIDYAAASLFLRQSDIGLMPVQGTAIGDAIRIAEKMFKTEEKKYKVLIIFSDGEDLETNPVEAAKEAAEKGIVIYTVGVGTPQGGPIPLKKNGQIAFKKDKSGKIVVTRLSDATLREIADIGNGIYINVDSGRAGLERIYKAISEMQKKDLGERVFSDYEDRFQGFALMALLFLIIFELIAPASPEGREDV